MRNSRSYACHRICDLGNLNNSQNLLLMSETREEINKASLTDSLGPIFRFQQPNENTEELFLTLFKKSFLLHKESSSAEDFEGTPSKPTFNTLVMPTGGVKPIAKSLCQLLTFTVTWEEINSCWNTANFKDIFYYALPISIWTCQSAMILLVSKQIQTWTLLHCPLFTQLWFQWGLTQTHPKESKPLQELLWQTWKSQQP